MATGSEHRVFHFGEAAAACVIAVGGDRSARAGVLPGAGKTGSTDSPSEAARTLRRLFYFADQFSGSLSVGNRAAVGSVRRLYAARQSGRTARSVRLRKFIQRRV